MNVTVNNCDNYNNTYNSDYNNYYNILKVKLLVLIEISQLIGRKIRELDLQSENSFQVTMIFCKKCIKLLLVIIITIRS